MLAEREMFSSSVRKGANGSHQSEASTDLASPDEVVAIKLPSLIGKLEGKDKTWMLKP